MLIDFPLGRSILPIRKAQSCVRQAAFRCPTALETYNFPSQPAAGHLRPEFLASVDTDQLLQRWRAGPTSAAPRRRWSRRVHLDHRSRLPTTICRRLRACTGGRRGGAFSRWMTTSSVFRHLTPRQKVDKDACACSSGFCAASCPIDVTKSKRGFGLPIRDLAGTMHRSRR